MLKPGQKVQLEPGAMAYMSDGVKARLSVGGLGRLITEGNIFKTLYTNDSKQMGYVGVTANFPATIIPLRAERYDGVIKCKHDAFLASTDPDCGVSVGDINSASCVGCCCAAMPLFLQQITSNNGWIFLAAYGAIIHKKLSAGEKIVVDSFALIACTKDVTVDVKMTGGCSVMCCGGEGLFNTELVGPGEVWLSSMPIEKLRRLFPRRAHKKKVKPPSSNV